MTKPPRRSDLPPRNDEHRKRWLTEDMTPATLADRFHAIRYGCSGKHKSNPYIYGAAPYHGKDSDRSLCDDHATFGQADMARIPSLFVRAQAAGLTGNLIWSVDDTGWIYELQLTNAGLNEWHGYPVLTTDPFARKVWRRFAQWAPALGSKADQDAADACALRYGLKP